VNTVKLTGYKPNRGRSPFTVEAEFTASIYIFKELGSPVTTAVEQEPKNARPGPPRPARSQTGAAEGRPHA